VSCCCAPSGIAEQFGRRTARRELKRYRGHGASATTAALIGALRARDVGGATLIDIGGGVGAIHHDLLDAGAARATHVDISPDYIAAAKDEAERRGHGGRVEFVLGDFTELAATLPEADVVTLDRVICCYPHMERLVGLSAGKARRLYGAVYPRKEWWVAAALRAANALLWLGRRCFRVYLHDPAAIDAVLRGAGFSRAKTERTFVWEVVVYVKS